MGEVLKKSNYVTVVDNPEKMFDFSQFTSESRNGTETFTGDGTNTSFTLTTTYDVTSIDSVTVNGV